MSHGWKYGGKVEKREIPSSSWSKFRYISIVFGSDKEKIYQDISLIELGINLILIKTVVVLMNGRGKFPKAQATRGAFEIQFELQISESCWFPRNQFIHSNWSS